MDRNRSAPLYQGHHIILTLATVIALVTSFVGRSANNNVIQAVSNRMPNYINNYEHGETLACAENLANQLGIGRRIAEYCLIAARRMQSPDGAPG